MMRRKAFRLKLPSRTLLLGERTLVMGVLNVTPDSFSDGGQFLDATRAIEHALAIESAGADVLDIGGESTRPGSSGTPADEEPARVGAAPAPISIYTYTQRVDGAEAAVAERRAVPHVIYGITY